MAIVILGRGQLGEDALTVLHLARDEEAERSLDSVACPHQVVPTRIVAARPQGIDRLATIAPG